MKFVGCIHANTSVLYITVVDYLVFVLVKLHNPIKLLNLLSYETDWFWLTSYAT
jgi:hypothetical protein